MAGVAEQNRPSSVRSGPRQEAPDLMAHTGLGELVLPRRDPNPNALSQKRVKMLGVRCSRGSRAVLCHFHRVSRS